MIIVHTADENQPFGGRISSTLDSDCTGDSASRKRMKEACAVVAR
jgi:hypothetical protein